MKIFKRLFSYVTPHWRTILMVLVCTAVVNVLTLAQPLLFRDLLNKVLLQKNLPVLRLIVVLVLLLIGVKGLFLYGQGYLMNFLGLSSVKQIREEMFVKLQHLPLSFFETWRTGEVFSRLITDVGVLTEVMGTSVVYLANDFLVLAGSICWMAWHSPIMTMLAFVVSPLIAVAVLRFGKWMNHVTSFSQSKVADLSNVLFEGITGIQVVKSCGREEYEIQKFKNKNEEYFTWSLKSVQVTFTQTPVIEFLAVLGIAVMVYYGGVEVVKGHLSIGDMFAFWGYMVLATNPLYRLSSTLTNLQKASAAAERIFQIIDARQESDSASGGLPVPEVAGKVEFNHVWFRYNEEEPWVLEDVTLSVDRGTVVALIGPSGAGKSSLVGLIPRFYNPVQGQVLVDGVDIANFPLKQLRSYIGIVTQEILLFSGTIGGNIMYGKPEATAEQVLEAARSANAHEFIQELPHGYETMVGERGITLSAGQRQRIAIARALLRDPRILILDEATSNLDTESELLIQQALQRLMAGRTTFIIAHRLSTIRNADKIVAIEDGKIVEVGSHHDLLAKSGLYSRLYLAQSKAREA